MNNFSTKKYILEYLYVPNEAHMISRNYVYKTEVLSIQHILHTKSIRLAHICPYLVIPSSPLIEQATELR
jgi:hypothetical protein